MSDLEKLLPCPFCASSNVWQHDNTRGDPSVSCSTCGGAMSYGNTPNEAIKAWNTRAPTTKQEARDAD